MPNFNELLSSIETAGMWSYFHKDWLLQIRQALRGQLPAEYRIFVESEAVLISPEVQNPTTGILPDIAVARSDSDLAMQKTPSNLGTTAIVEIEEVVETETHYSLLIRRAPENLVVAALELLSPSNKGLGNRWDRERHLRKREDYLQSGVSLLEVDGLIQGVRDLPEPLSALQNFQRIAWTACLRDGRRKYRGWGWNAADPLPQISWQIDSIQTAIVDFPRTLQSATDFNHWEELVRGGGNA